MHYLMLVTITMLPGETSPEARARIHSELLEDGTFCGDGGRFSVPVCDWFVIGGRWSGLLGETVMGDAYREKLRATFRNSPAITARIASKSAPGNSTPSGGNSEALVRRPSTATHIGISATTMTPCHWPGRSTTGCSPSTRANPASTRIGSAARSSISTTRNSTKPSSAANGSRSLIITTNQERNRP